MAPLLPLLSRAACFGDRACSRSRVSLPNTVGIRCGRWSCFSVSASFFVAARRYELLSAFFVSCGRLSFCSFITPPGSTRFGRLASAD